jgi:NAD(P)-dependent dehydrogenase (short-subunit alcohol dehydrogenase family)
LDVNLRSSFILISFFKDMLIKSNGCVVNLSCEKGSRPDPGALGYSMVKAGLEMLTKSVALELANFGVRVNAVAPSFVETNLYRYSTLPEDEIKKLSIAES